MARNGYAKELNHLKILKMCQGIIENYFDSPKPSKIIIQKMHYATMLYGKSIPTELKLPEDSKIQWTTIINNYDNAHSTEKVK